MQPMGRKFYKDKTGGKHTLKNSKKPIMVGRYL